LVGQALLRRCTNVPSLPCLQTSLVIGALTGDSDSWSLWFSQADFEGRWLIWLVDSFVETMCEASAAGDESTVGALVALCVALGGDVFAGAVCGAVSQSSTRDSRTSLQLAVAGGHFSVVEVLSRQIGLAHEHLPASPHCAHAAFPNSSDTVAMDLAQEYPHDLDLVGPGSNCSIAGGLDSTPQCLPTLLTSTLANQKASDFVLDAWPSVQMDGLVKQLTGWSMNSMSDI